MPIGEIVGETLGGVLRFAGRILFEILFEVIIQGTGYVLIRIFRPNAVPGDVSIAVVGLIFWAAVGSGGYFFCHTAAA